MARAMGRPLACVRWWQRGQWAVPAAGMKRPLLRAVLHALASDGRASSKYDSIDLRDITDALLRRR